MELFKGNGHKMKRKICTVVASRANYGRVKYLMKAVVENKNLELQLVVGASTLLYRFGKAIDIIRADGFVPNKTIHYILEGETLTTQAKSTGMGIIELSTAFEELNPDIVVTIADRFETMSTAIAATYLNIPLAHLQGGEISGNIDERVRHAITKLSDIHFPATEKSKERLIKMGENSDFIFNFGCPSIDVLVNEDLSINNEIMSPYGGVGTSIDWEKPYVLLVQHPVTTSYGKSFSEISETLNALKEIKSVQKIVLWPNADAGTDDTSKAIRIFRENNRNEPFHYFRNFSPEDYARVLNNSLCTVGNSSSFIREGSFLGAPSVMVGDRQEGREHGKNITFVNYDKNLIKKAVEKQIEHGRFARETIFGDGTAGEKMASKLEKIDLNIKKRMSY